jgi:hypothetical protein
MRCKDTPFFIHLYGKEEKPKAEVAPKKAK